jgi:hypothetical protein
MKTPKRSPAESPLLFEIDSEPIEECLTALGGVPLLLQAARSLGLPRSIREQVRIKERDRGLDEASYVESFVVLNAVGGECLEDFERLREDAGLAEMMGHDVPSPEAARKFLYQFHDENKIAEAQQQLALGEASYIPEESAPLRGLAQANREVVQEVGRRCRDQKIATVDLDSTIIESEKREAKPTYQGGKGYQPMLALWAEMDLVLADEFRDGNVPALQDPLRVAQQAFQALPTTIEERYFRGDSACYEERLLRWLSDEQRQNGPRGPIGFAISARMNQGLRDEIQAVGEGEWEFYDQDPEVIKECVELDYSPSGAGREARRYLSIRIRRKQGDLFKDGSSVKHFAVVSNIWDWTVQRLLKWHREKAGSIEALHDVIKNELAGGVLPCGRFGANAAWFRLAVITHNVLSALKRLALPPELIAARPKRLRFLIFHTPGKLVHHARRTVLRLARAWNRFSNWRYALKLLPVPA